MRVTRVSAIVLDYFGADQTERCLRSLAQQGIETVYVVDNSTAEAPTADLRKAIHQLGATGVDFKTEIISAGKNLGFAKGVNFALAHDRASPNPHDYYLLLNNDAVAGPGLVPGLLAALHREPGAALVAPRIVSNDPGREYGIWYHRYLGLLLSRPGWLRFHYFTGCCLLFSKDLVGDGRLFDEAFFMYGEDAELAWRLTRQGRQMICATDVFVEHEFGPSVDRVSFFYEYHMLRSHLLLSLRTCLHSAEIPLLLLTKYSALACRAILRSLRHRNASPLVGYFLSVLPLRITK